MATKIGCMTKAVYSTLPVDAMRAWAVCAIALIHCGGTTIPRTESLAKIRAARTRVVATVEDQQDVNLVTRDVVESRALEGMTRPEITELLGRGTPCSGTPRCMARGFEGDDLAFDIGADSATGSLRRLPMLFVGFD